MISRNIEKVIREERKRVIDREVNMKSSLRWYREVGGSGLEVLEWGMKRKMRLELEMDGRYVWCGEEFVTDHVEEAC